MGKFVYNDFPNKGFSLEFDNGYTLSVQWAGTNYCSNRHKEFPSNESATAEICVIDSAGKQQEPIGWQNMEHVLAKMQEIASINTGKRWFAFC
jgi:hypothetical protein